MPRSSARIPLVQRPVNQSIKKHRCGTREHHADDNQNKNSQRRPAIRGNNERAQRKRQCKNCMRKTNQSQKTRHRSADPDLLPCLVHAGTLLQKAAKKTKVVMAGPSLSLFAQSARRSSRPYPSGFTGKCLFLRCSGTCLVCSISTFSIAVFNSSYASLLFAA